MMKRLLSLAMVGLFTIGCGGGETPTSTPPAGGGAAPSSEAGSGEKKAEEGSGRSSFQFNLVNPTTVSMVVPGIHCEACAKGVEETLAMVDGVEEIDIDVETKTATVTISESDFDKQGALDALAEKKYIAAADAAGDATVEANVETDES